MVVKSYNKVVPIQSDCAPNRNVDAHFFLSICNRVCTRILGYSRARSEEKTAFFIFFFYIIFRFYKKILKIFIKNDKKELFIYFMSWLLCMRHEAVFSSFFTLFLVSQLKNLYRFQRKERLSSGKTFWTT